MPAGSSRNTGSSSYVLGPESTAGITGGELPRGGFKTELPGKSP